MLHAKWRRRRKCARRPDVDLASSFKSEETSERCERHCAEQTQFAHECRRCPHRRNDPATHIGRPTEPVRRKIPPVRAPAAPYGERCPLTKKCDERKGIRAGSSIPQRSYNRERR